MKYELFLPNKPVIENDDFVVYANEELSLFANDMMEYLITKKKEILDFFSIN